MNVHIVKLYSNESVGVDLTTTTHPPESTTIDLSLPPFPWAPFCSTRAAVKMHTLLDLRGNIPRFIQISDNNPHNVNIFDRLIPQAGAVRIGANRRPVDCAPKAWGQT